MITCDSLQSLTDPNADIDVVVVNFKVAKLAELNPANITFKLAMLASLILVADV